jgi:alkanesulfonate monooxygenase SsuD/methylene tetrahydromethanopterin reductase-like flavin-dependent oxidoreductase (luciferase family)
MIPADNSSASPKKPDPSPAPPTPESSGQNGASEKKSGIWPFDGPQPYKLTPEELESLRQLWTEEDEEKAAADLRDILENGGGISSAEFLRAIEQAASDNG